MKQVIERFNAVGYKAAAFAAVSSAQPSKWQRHLQAAAPLLLLLAVVLVPSLAHAQSQPWETTAQKTYDLIMSIARWVAIIAVVACGLAAIFGKLSWDWAGKIIIGLVLIFGGTYLVDYFANGM